MLMLRVIKRAKKHEQNLTTIRRGLSYRVSIRESIANLAMQKVYLKARQKIAAAAIRRVVASMQLQNLASISPQAKNVSLVTK